MGYKDFSEPSNIEATEEVEEVAREGAFSSIPPTRRIGDMAHGGNRVVNGIFTRVMKCVGGEWGVGAGGKKRVKEVWNEIRDEASSLPVAERGDRVCKRKKALEQSASGRRSMGGKGGGGVECGGEGHSTQGNPEKYTTGTHTQQHITEKHEDTEETQQNTV